MRRRGWTLVWDDAEERLGAPVRLVLAAVLFLAIGQVLLVWATALARVGASLVPAARVGWLALVAAVGFAAGILGVLAVARGLDRRRPTDLGVALDREWLVDAGVGAAIGAGTVAAVIAVALLAGVAGVARSGPGLVSLPTPSLLAELSFWLVVFLGAGALEEVLFRGYLLVNLAEGLRGVAGGDRRAVVGGVIASAVPFGLVHAANPGGSSLGVVAIVLFGLLLGGSVAATGRLGLAVGLHVAWNATLGVGFGLPVSGIETGAALVDVELSGPPLVTGGAFGPEGGLLAIVGLVGGVAAVGWVLARRGSLSVDGSLARPTLVDDE